MIFLFYISRLFIFVFSCGFSVISSNSGNQQKHEYVTILESQVIDHTAVREIIPKRFLPLIVFIESDVLYDRDEILYAMNLKENELIQREDFLLGIQRFSKKDRFSKVQIAVENLSAGVQLFIKMVGKHIIKEIKIDGIWHDVDIFKRLYQCQKFEPFDQKKHEQGVVAIKEYFHAIGYCNAQVHDQIIYDDIQKHVFVRLYIQPGKKFKMMNVKLVYDALSLEHEELVRNIFNEYCLSKILYQEYTHERLNKYIFLFVEQLRLHGFVSNSLYCTEILEKDSHEVFLIFGINTSYQKRISFIGNKFFSSKELFDHIYTVFKNERLITTEIVREELLSLYLSYGFFHAAVSEKENISEVIYSIVEENQSRIAQIDFSLLNIEDFAKIKYQRLLSQQLIGRPAHELTIQRALDLCINELIYDGFLGARTVEYRYEKLENDTAVLHITLDSGKQVYIDDVVVLSEEPIAAIAADVFKLKKRSLVDLVMLAKQRDQLLFLLYNAGYVHAIVHPELHVDNEQSFLLWHVTPGKQVHFGKIIISGNSVIPFRSIKQHIAFQTGELWQQNLIQQSLENLQKLSIYEHIEIYPELYTTQNTQDLFLCLIPDDPFEMRFRLGTELQYIQDYQSFGGITYKMGGSFIAKNRLCRADTLRFDADFAGNHQEVILSYNLPAAFPNWISLPLSNIWNVKTQGYHMRYAQPGVIGYPKNIYTVGRDGFLCALCAAKDTSYLNLSWGFELQKTTIKNKRYADIIAHLINFDDHLLGKQVPYIFFETNGFFDFLDDKIYPTRGVSSLFSLRFMFPCRDQTRYFIKFLYEQTCFVSLLSCILGLRFRLGYMFHKDFSKISPMERFYLGGSHSMRGYEADLFPPTSPLVEESGKVVYIPRGGKIMFNINTELRKKLISYFTIALFHDIGALADDIESIYAMLPLYTSGFGFRFDTPFGPLRFDIGWKWKLTHPEERRYAWYLSFGRSF